MNELEDWPIELWHGDIHCAQLIVGNPDTACLDIIKYADAYQRPFSLRELRLAVDEHSRECAIANRDVAHQQALDDELLVDPRYLRVQRPLRGNAAAAAIVDGGLL